MNSLDKDSQESPDRALLQARKKSLLKAIGALDPKDSILLPGLKEDLQQVERRLSQSRSTGARLNEAQQK
eukprot:6243712-Prorocentrum_lima.AAC.1